MKSSICGGIECNFNISGTITCPRSDSQPVLTPSTCNTARMFRPAGRPIPPPPWQRAPLRDAAGRLNQPGETCPSLFGVGSEMAAAIKRPLFPFHTLPPNFRCNLSSTFRIIKGNIAFDRRCAAWRGRERPAAVSQLKVSPLPTPHRPLVEPADYSAFQGCRASLRL